MRSQVKRHREHLERFLASEQRERRNERTLRRTAKHEQVLQLVRHGLRGGLGEAGGLFVLSVLRGDPHTGRDGRVAADARVLDSQSRQERGAVDESGSSEHARAHAPCQDECDKHVLDDSATLHLAESLGSDGQELHAQHGRHGVHVDRSQQSRLQLYQGKFLFCFLFSTYSDFRFYSEFCQKRQNKAKFQK